MARTTVCGILIFISFILLSSCTCMGNPSILLQLQPCPNPTLPSMPECTSHSQLRSQIAHVNSMEGVQSCIDPRRQSQQVVAELRVSICQIPHPSECFQRSVQL